MKQIKVQYNGKVIKVSKGTNLRKALLTNGMSSYNGTSKYLNCKGLGSCGTCAVKLSVDSGPKTKIEKWRLSFPPHKEGSGLRLACQVVVCCNMEVTKGKGFWGEK